MMVGRWRSSQRRCPQDQLAAGDESENKCHCDELNREGGQRSKRRKCWKSDREHVAKMCQRHAIGWNAYDEGGSYECPGDGTAHRVA